MNRETKIIICISAIIIIILGLIGFTYGYYLTRVTGNNNGKSIEVTTGTSSVLYTDLTEEIDIIIEPGASTTKLFTVENTGNVEATYSIYLVDVINEFVRTEDVRYTIYRVGNTDIFPENYNGCTETTTDLNSCKIVANDQEFPTNSTVVVANETIETPENYFKYALVTTYINQPTINQNIDQGHTYSAKVNIRGAEGEVNPYSEGTLAYEIMKNAISGTNGTKFLETSLTVSPATTSKTTESVISTTQDDYGISYYYRGNVKNNYLNFADMCWRIVRIQGNGTIKLILEDKSALCDGDNYTGDWTYGNAYYGHTRINNSYVVSNYVNGEIPGMVENLLEFQNTKLSNVTDKLSVSGWCVDTTAYTDKTGTTSLTETEKSSYYKTSKEFQFGSSVRYENFDATLVCPVELINKFKDNSNMYAGALTTDEIAYAGLNKGASQTNIYLINQFQINNSYTYRAVSPLNFNGAYDYASTVRYDGALGYHSVNVNDAYVRPVIVLRFNALYTDGSGIKTDPYEIG